MFGEAVLYCSGKETIIDVISSIDNGDVGHGVTVMQISLLGDQVAADVNGDQTMYTLVQERKSDGHPSLLKAVPT